jgi:hypothetical protein
MWTFKSEYYTMAVIQEDVITGFFTAEYRINLRGKK